MTLSDYQRSFGGVTIGDGTVYNLESENGLEGFTVRSGSTPIPREDGAIPGLHLVDMKTAAIVVEVAGEPEDIEDEVRALLSAFAPARQTQDRYLFKNPGQFESFVWARPLRFERSRTIEAAGGIQRFNVALEVTDPRIYSTTLNQELVPEFGASGGGFDFVVVDFPINMSASTQQQAVAVNDGTRDAYPIFQFHYDSGTVSGVQVTNLATGVVLDIDTTLTTGQILTADMDALIRATGDSVIRIGTSSRYGDWQTPRDPLYLAPGSNTLQLETAGGGSVVCVVQWRDTS